MKEETFELFGTKWTIIYVDEIKVDEGFQYGLADYVNRRITIATKDTEGKSFPKEELEITKLHELIHSILATRQYKTVSDDEPLVEWLARSIYSLMKQKVIK